MLHLFKTRRFWPLFGTQLLGVLNDNLLKGALVALVGFRATDQGLSAGVLVQLVTGLLVLPFFLFSAYAGELSDRCDRAMLARRLKSLEVLVMGIAAAGWSLDSLPILFLSLFLMGTQSAFFGPVKYALLPQHLPPRDLVAGNGLVEAGSFMAILLGSVAGALLMAGAQVSPWLAPALLALAVLGWLCARFIPPAPVEGRPAQRARLGGSSRRVLGLARSRTALWRCIAALSAFWAFGAVLMGQLPDLAREVLAGDAHTLSWLLCAFTAGIALGAVLVERVWQGRIELGIVPVTAAVLGLLCLDLAWLVRTGGVLEAGQVMHLYALLVALGTAGGAMTVPLYAYLQRESQTEECARVVAANNIMNAVYIVVAVALVAALQWLGVSLPGVLVLLGVVSLCAALLGVRLMLRRVARLLLAVLVRAVYRVRVQGQARIPEQGGALLVCNHVSFNDALVLAALSPRPLRFVMHYRIYGHFLLRPVLKSLGVIPIARASEDPAVLREAFEQIDRALADGELVAIFPEGGITQDGEVAPFRDGVQRILNRRPVPVLPCALSGLWGSFFSRARGRAMSGLPRRLWARVRLNCGALVAAEEVQVEDLRTQVLDLRGGWK